MTTGRSGIDLSGIDLRQRYRIRCECGQVLEGNRRRKQRDVICPECGAASFVMPPDVYPESPRVSAAKNPAKATPPLLPTAPDEPVSRQTESEPLIPLDDAGLSGRGLAPIDTAPVDPTPLDPPDQLDVDAALDLSGPMVPDSPLELDEPLDPTYSLQPPEEVVDPPAPPPPPSDIPSVNVDKDMGFFDPSELDEEWDDDDDQPASLIPDRKDAQTTEGQLPGVEDDLFDANSVDIDEALEEQSQKRAAEKSPVEVDLSPPGRIQPSEDDEPEEGFWEDPDARRKLGGRKRLRLVVGGMVLLLFATIGYQYVQGRRERAVEDYRLARQRGLDSIDEGQWTEAEAAFGEAIGAAAWIPDDSLDLSEVAQYHRETHARNELSTFSLVEALRRAQLDGENGHDPASSLSDDLAETWLVMDCRVDVREGGESPRFVIEFPLRVDERNVLFSVQSDILREYVGSNAGVDRRVLLAATVERCRVSDDEWEMILDGETLFLWCFPSTLPMLDDLSEEDEDRLDIERVLKSQADFLEIEWTDEP